MFRSVEQLKVGGHFSVMAKKGGTILTFCVFIPKVTGASV